MSNMWDDEKNIEWFNLSKRCERFVEKVSEREDIVVIVKPDVVEPATGTETLASQHSVPTSFFYPNLAKIVINASKIFDVNQQFTLINVDPNAFFGQRMFPKLTGVLVHESAHARFSHWVYPKDVNARIVFWGNLLEETRVEKKIVEDFPQYAAYLKTLLTEIVYKNFREENGIIYGKYLGAYAALLVCARETIEVLSEDEVKKVKETCHRLLTKPVYKKLESFWEAVQNCDDDVVAETVVEYAEKISELIDPKKEVPESELADSTVCGDVPNTISSPLADKGSAVKIIEQELENIAQNFDAGSRPPVVHPPVSQKDKQMNRREDISQHKKDLRQLATSGSEYYRPVKKVIPPDATDLSRMRSIVNALKSAQYREVSKSTLPSMLPPGRLQIREAMNRDAQVGSNQVITAKPWKQTRRREVDNPPLILAVATDVSGSMDSWQREVASFTWAVSSAVKSLNGKVGAVAWNTEPYSLIEPNTYSKDLVLCSCNGGSTGLPKSIKALDGLMSLSYSEGVRVLTIITDGFIGSSSVEAQKEIDFLANEGVIVVWLMTGKSGWVPKNVVSGVLKEPKDFGKVMSRVLIDALSGG